MNCPIRTDPMPDEGHNQNPPDMAPEINTNNTLNHRRNSIHGGRNSSIHLGDGSHDSIEQVPPATEVDRVKKGEAPSESLGEDGEGSRWKKFMGCGGIGSGRWVKLYIMLRRKVVKYGKFIGPGFMVSVSYIDPGNYATDVAAGASYRFRLLFMILLSNIFAIFLQSLCIRLGTVTGLNLAECCRTYCPRWLNYILYFFAEAAIIATDIAEVIGTAIALNVLLHIPLVAGCAISIFDVLVILFFYNPTGMSMRALRLFELFVAFLVLGVVICFAYQLSLIKGVEVREVFQGYLPSSALAQSQGLYQACGILGATVMPHSLYLGSGIVQNRLRDFDAHHPNDSTVADQDGAQATASRQVRVSTDTELEKYRPSFAAIKSCMNYSIIECAFSLFTFALFVNSAILITAGASLYGLPNDASHADLFGIHDLLANSIAPVAGTIFMLALLLSGTSAGIVVTIAGQIVSEGQLNLTLRPWIRRLITRSISITPSIIIAGAVGREGLSQALNASQVCLSVILPFVSAPLIYFTCRSKIMSVWTEDSIEPSVSNSVEPKSDEKNDSATPDAVELGMAPFGQGTQNTGRYVVMRNNWLMVGCAVVIWLIVAVMNIAMLVLVGLGKA